jgi:hypothetical protein
VFVAGSYHIVFHGIPVNRMAIWLERKVGKHAGEGNVMA